MNGLRTKLSLLKKSVALCSHDILVLVETGLKVDVKDAELGLESFSIYRFDRNSGTSEKSDGGGVLIAVKSHLACKQLKIPDSGVECVFVSVRWGKTDLILGAAYIPPQRPSRTYMDFCEATTEVLLSIPNMSEILLMGDFNQPNVSWDDHTLCPPNDSSKHMIDLANIFQMRQCNTVKNYRNVILDLVFSTMHNLKVYPAEEELLALDRNHPALEFSIETTNPQIKHIKTEIPNFHKCDLNGVLNWLQQINYPVFDRSTDANKLFGFFCSGFELAIRSSTPTRIICGNKFPKWFSKELKQLIILKKTLHKQFKTTLDYETYQQFSRVRARCKELATQCYQDYMDHVENALSDNIKVFWAHVRGLSGLSQSSKLSYAGVEAEEADEQCELFAQFFSSVYKNNYLPVQQIDFNTGLSISDCRFSAVDIEKKLEALDTSKGVGPDNIPPNVLKYCAPVLAPHLAIYFNVLLARGIFPDNLKVSFVIPIYKSGSREDVSNYRPITIQPVLAKVFESLVLERLAFSLEGIIAQEQHGFRKGRSTVTNLITFQEYIMSAFSKHHQVDCIYLDFSKAFDRVNHSILLAKLAGYGVHGSLLKWIESYLQGRGLLVKYRNSVSRAINMSSGVPQGSLLAPFLFTIFVNDIGTVIDPHVKFLMFADDIKLYSEIASEEDYNRLLDALSSIHRWCCQNDMDLNIKKCAILTFSRIQNEVHYNYVINEIPLMRIHKFKDLGVVLSSSFTSQEHVSHICSRANSLLGFIIRTTRDFHSTNAFLTLYKTIIRPILEYATVVWSPHFSCDVEALNRIQTRVVRLIGIRNGYRYLEVPVVELASRLSLLPLERRREINDLLFLHKLVNGKLDCPDLLALVDIRVPRGTRLKDTFAKRSLPTGYIYHSTIPRIMRLGNSLDGDIHIFGTSTDHLKRKLHDSAKLKYPSMEPTH